MSAPRERTPDCLATRVEEEVEQEQEQERTPAKGASSAPVDASVRESPHAKLAFLDVVQANMGPVDALTFFDTTWETSCMLQGSDRLSSLPNARLLANGGLAAAGVVIKQPASKGSAPRYQLVTSVSKGVLELGPRALQQDAVHVGAVRGCVPFVVVCDGHGYVNMLNNQPSETSLDVRNTLHVGGRQVSAWLCCCFLQLLLLLAR